jgi:hypothetical protein
VEWSTPAETAESAGQRVDRDRFDKLAVRYQATICVADIFIWLRARPDRPRDDPRNTP